ncbi:Serine/threonine-protein phosphatase 6 regulatory ankyrin repeat subunit C [Tolypocladium ophioglossoides CBS 100239]|uniref:Serine/threonine-protein phosphatase 6 regulatory ankyrin repeat subunit C n=1 Tax=Tolypocladium ophioglossoides (strain CBS 100239) TaxID=1163406 RepID=A0A0L0N5F8_TOLOC|nr:Serine/threonine-protein phosphatase 6 regulatory ankyrin repeat subunit C [Tolypocladium ophioglossoides CBS 100239]
MEENNCPLSRLPNELLFRIIDFTYLVPSPKAPQAEDQTSGGHGGDDLMEESSDDEDSNSDDEVSTSSDEDEEILESEETERVLRELEVLERECRRNLFNLTNVRPFHLDATRMLYTHFGYVGLRYAAKRNDTALAERCFAYCDSSSLRLNSPQEGWTSLVAEGTVLHTAVEAGSADLVSMLLDKGCSIEAKAEVSLNNDLGVDYNDWCPGADVSPLGLSLILGHRAVSRILLDRGALITVGVRKVPRGKDEWILNAVHAAAMSDDGEIMVTLLQQYGISPDSPDGRGYTPLHWAICTPRGFGNVEMLLDAGADVRTPNCSRGTLLDFMPWIRGKPDEIEAVFRMVFTAEAQSTINRLDASGITRLGHAARQLNVDMMRLYLQNGADPSLGLCVQARPLHQCLSAHARQNAANFDMKVAEAGLTAVKLILDAGLRGDPKLVFGDMLKANLGVATEFLLELATHFSFSHEDLEHLFVYIGSQVSWSVNTSLTFLLDHFAPTDPALLDRWSVFDRLLGTPSIRDPNILKLAGPNFDPNRPSRRHGATGFVAVLQNSRYTYSRCRPVVEALLRRGANVNARDERGVPCLHLYYFCHLHYYDESDENSAGESVPEATQSFCALVHQLSEYGYDFNARDGTHGDTVLHVFAGGPIADLRGECVEALVAHGADVTIRNDDGMTPLDRYQRTVPNIAMSQSPMRGSFERAIRAALPSAGGRRLLA